MIIMSRVVDLSINNCTMFFSSIGFYKNNQVWPKTKKKKRYSYCIIKFELSNQTLQIYLNLLYRNNIKYKWNWMCVVKTMWKISVYFAYFIFLVEILWVLKDSLGEIRKRRIEENWPPHVQHCLKILHTWRLLWADQLNWTRRFRKGHPVSSLKRMI